MKDPRRLTKVGLSFLCFIVDESGQVDARTRAYRCDPVARVRPAVLAIPPSNPLSVAGSAAEQRPATSAPPAAASAAASSPAPAELGNPTAESSQTGPMGGRDEGAAHNSASLTVTRQRVSSVMYRSDEGGLMESWSLTKHGQL